MFKQQHRIKAQLLFSSLKISMDKDFVDKQDTHPEKSIAFHIFTLKAD